MSNIRYMAGFPQQSKNITRFDPLYGDSTSNNPAFSGGLFVTIPLLLYARDWLFVLGPVGTILLNVFEPHLEALE